MKTVSVLEAAKILGNGVTLENCGSCSNLAASFVIIKYHHHNRNEFALCDECAIKAQLAYSRQGGVLEIVTYPLLGEEWKMP